MMQLLIGFMIGVGVAAPIGPSGLLCLRRSIADGKLAGFMTGLGAAVADALMAIVAAFGVKAIISFVEGHRHTFQICGGVMLVIMGIFAMRTKPPSRTAGPLHAPSLAKAFLSTVALTLANPVTIFSLIVLFSFFGVSIPKDDWIGPSLLVLGVFLGSTAWWALLSHFADWFGRKLNTRLLRTINICTGGLLCVIAAYQFVSAWMGW